MGNSPVDWCEGILDGAHRSCSCDGFDCEQPNQRASQAIRHQRRCRAAATHAQPHPQSRALAVAAADHQFFDVFSDSMQEPATLETIFVTFLLFTSAWDVVVCLTTGPAMGPILRGIIQVWLQLCDRCAAVAAAHPPRTFDALFTLDRHCSHLFQLFRDSHVLSFVGSEPSVFVRFGFSLQRNAAHAGCSSSPSPHFLSSCKFPIFPLHRVLLPDPHLLSLHARAQVQRVRRLHAAAQLLLARVDG